MWWEYVIIIACLLAAVLYCLALIRRAFRGKGTACGSATCRCAGESAEPDRQVKVTSLVQIRTPEP